MKRRYPQLEPLGSGLDFCLPSFLLHYSADRRVMEADLPGYFLLIVAMLEMGRSYRLVSVCLCLAGRKQTDQQRTHRKTLSARDFPLSSLFSQMRQHAVQKLLAAEKTLTCQRIPWRPSTYPSQYKFPESLPGSLRVIAELSKQPINTEEWRFDFVSCHGSET